MHVCDRSVDRTDGKLFSKDTCNTLRMTLSSHKLTTCWRVAAALGTVQRDSAPILDLLCCRLLIIGTRAYFHDPSSSAPGSDRAGGLARWFDHHTLAHFLLSTYPSPSRCDEGMVMTWMRQAFPFESLENAYAFSRRSQGRAGQPLRPTLILFCVQLFLSIFAVHPIERNRDPCGRPPVRRSPASSAATYNSHKRTRLCARRMAWEHTNSMTVGQCVGRDQAAVRDLPAGERENFRTVLKSRSCLPVPAHVLSDKKSSHSFVIWWSVNRIHTSVHPALFPNTQK